MRCKACDAELTTDIELTRKDKYGTFFDLCNTCYTVSMATEWELDADVYTFEGEDNNGIITNTDYLTKIDTDDILL